MCSFILYLKFDFSLPAVNWPVSQNIFAKNFYEATMHQHVFFCIGFSTKISYLYNIDSAMKHIFYTVREQFQLLKNIFFPILRFGWNKMY